MTFQRFHVTLGAGDFRAFSCDIGCRAWFFEYVTGTGTLGRPCASILLAAGLVSCPDPALYEYLNLIGTREFLCVLLSGPKIAPKVTRLFSS